MSLENNLPVLSAEEIRVLGSLIEKSKTTPDYYPMTVNAITAACNQKTSRKPVVDYSEETVIKALNNLKSISLVSTAVGGGSRTVKYKHNFTTVYEISNAELTVLGLLFLRGAQTPGELNTNSGRMYEFESLNQVHDVLNKLATAQPPFAKELPRQAGQKETRFVHLLGETIVESDVAAQTVNSNNTLEELEERLLKVETELAELKATINQLLN